MNVLTKVCWGGFPNRSQPVIETTACKEHIQCYDNKYEESLLRTGTVSNMFMIKFTNQLVFGAHLHIFYSTNAI